MGVESEVTIITTESDPPPALIVTQEGPVNILTITGVGPQGIPGGIGATGPPGAAGATVLTYAAGINLSGHRMVVLNDSAEAVYADNTVTTHANKVIGMTIGAAMAGADATIQSGGELAEPSWSWTLNVPIWLSSNGLLTQVVPVSGFSLIVGFPITATKMFIDIREPIYLI